MKQLIVIILLTCLLGACTTKNWYESGRSSQRTECIKAAVTPDQQDECWKQQGPDYEQYEKSRQEISKK